jgi:FkbM family methyltransferase
MRSVASTIRRKVINLYKREILRDEFLLEAKRWFADRGDQTRRMRYPLDADSIVVDLGGYRGDFAAAIYDAYKCTVHVFEPVPSLCNACSERFRENKKIFMHCFGLGTEAGHFPISDGENESSFINRTSGHDTILAEVRPVVDTFDELALSSIDLLKINIEGGEYDVIPACIESGWITKIRNLQVQFHNFVPDAEKKRDDIREALSKTHRETWCYRFMWENWELIEDGPQLSK